MEKFTAAYEDFVSQTLAKLDKDLKDGKLTMAEYLQAVQSVCGGPNPKAQISGR